MSRNDEALRLAEELMSDIELSRSDASAHALKAMRLARLTRNTAAQEWLFFELNGAPRTAVSEEWMTRTKRWTDRNEGKGYWGSASSIQATVDAMRLALNGHSAPVNLSGDYVVVAMNNRASAINKATGNITRLEQVLRAVDAQLYELAAQTHAELTYSEMQRRFFEQIQADVDTTLGAFTGGALRMIDSVSERLGSGDAPAVSQAMTTCRQLIDATADHLFPPSQDPYTGMEGRALDVKADKVKNRLNAHIHRAGVSGGRAERLGTTLNHLYARVSAGVHSETAVDAHEARFLFLATYAYLGEVLTLAAPASQ